jgi:protein-disulfide isomerase
MAHKAKVIVEVIPPKDIITGNPDAAVTLVEFGDYESEACAKANEVVKQLMEKYEEKLNFNFRHFPLTQIYQRSMKAAEAAVAASQEGKFWEMHNMLFAQRRNLGLTSLKVHSKEAGVTNKKFLEELMNSTYGWHVRNDLLEGLDMGVRDVPTFFINGELFTGKPTFESLSKGIDAALKTNRKKADTKQRA